MAPSPVLRSISPEAGPEEVAAIVAAVAAVGGPDGDGAPQLDTPQLDTPQLDAWVQGSRLAARRAGLQRGSWRLAGRIGRRARA
jgi:hypothetical protein